MRPGDVGEGLDPNQPAIDALNLPIECDDERRPLLDARAGLAKPLLDHLDPGEPVQDIRDDAHAAFLDLACRRVSCA